MPNQMTKKINREEFSDIYEKIYNLCPVPYILYTFFSCVLLIEDSSSGSFRRALQEFLITN